MGGNPISSVPGSISRYNSDVRGVAGVVVALMGALFAGFAIMAVDVGTTEFKRQALQRALDSAVLSAAISSSVIETDEDIAALESAVLEHVVATLPANLSEDVTVVVDAVSDEESGTTTIEASATIPNPWLSDRFFKTDLEGKLTVNNELTRPDARSAEIALVLDNTWSMSAGSRMPDLKNAATVFANALMTEGAPIKIAVVPYTEYVNVGIANRSASWLSVESDSSKTTSKSSCSTPCLESKTTVTKVEKCTGGCSGGKCTDGICTPKVCTPKVCNMVDESKTTCVKLGTKTCTMVPSTTNRTWSGCVGSRPAPLNAGDSPATGINTYPGLMDETKCPAALTPLTTNKATVIAAINAMAPLNPHETYIPAGLTWGLAALTPSAPLTEAATASGALQKVLVLMTDGENTRSMKIHSKNAGKWGHEGSDKSAANTLTADLCSNIKALDITVYTVALSVTDPATAAMLTGCASGSDKAFTASNGAQLADAFKSIANSLKEMSLVN